MKTVQGPTGSRHQAVSLQVDIGEVRGYPRRSAVAFSTATWPRTWPSARPVFPLQIPTTLSTSFSENYLPNMNFSSATRFENLEAYTAATTAQKEGLTIPVLARFTIARGERATAEQLSVNQVLLTCAEAIEAATVDGRPNLVRLVISSQGAGADGAANPHADRNAKRVLVQATGEYLWGCADNGGLLSAGKGAVFPSAMPPQAWPEARPRLPPRRPPRWLRRRSGEPGSH